MSNISQQTGCYTPTNIAFTAENIKHLCSGQPTMISANQCNKGRLCYMSKRHMACIQKGMHSGGHIRLHKFSRAQMRHNIRGGGWFSDLKDKAIGLAKKHLPGLIDKGKDWAIGQAKKQIGKYAPQVIDKVVGHAGKYVGAANASKVGDLVKGQVAKHTGHGIRGCGMKGCRGAKCGRFPMRQGGRVKKGGKLYTVASPTEYDRFDPVNKRYFGRGKKATVSTGKSILNESGW